MQLADRYRWEAEYPDGRIETVGESIAGAIRVSVIPVGDAWLPRHDLVGLEFVRRCGYGVTCSGVGVKAVALETKEYLHCIVTKTARYHVRCSTGAAIVTPVDYELFL